MPQQRSGVTGRSIAAHRERPGPAPGLGQALGVEDDLALAAHVLARLLHGGDVALPGDVHGHAVLGGLDHDPQAAQGLEHLDAERPDGEVAPVDQRRRGTHDVLGAAVAHVDEGVDHAEVRVLAVAEDGEPVTRARVHVEVVAVVEVAVARGGVGDELGRLVDGVVVPGGEGHVGVPQQQAQPLPQPPATGAPHMAAGRLGRQAGGGEDGKQAPGAHVPVGAARRRVGIGHGPALVEDGVTGRTAEFVDGHGGGPPARQPTRRPPGVARRHRGVAPTAGRSRRSARRCTRPSRRAGTARPARSTGSRRGPVPSRHRPS